MDISSCFIVASLYYIFLRMMAAADPATAADPAATLVALHAALGRCGLDQPAQDSVIAIEGMVHIAMFGMLATADIACIFKVIHT
jgi:hypothetical protein